MCFSRWFPDASLQEAPTRQFLPESSGAGVCVGCRGTARRIREPGFSELPLFSPGHPSSQSLLCLWPSFQETFLTAVANADIFSPLLVGFELNTSAGGSWGLWVLHPRVVLVNSEVVNGHFSPLFRSERSFCLVLLVIGT